MKYLIAQDWQNTHGNHAGMVHMCRLLCQNYPDKYTMLVKDCPTPMPKRNRIAARLLGWYDRKVYRKKYVQEYMELCQPMFDKLKGGDEVFLLEYHWPSTSQLEIAQYIRENFQGVKINALSHLTPTWYGKIRGSKKMILDWEACIDRQLTLGSSLTQYFNSLGVPKNKISTGFHYVDRDYYDAKEVVKHTYPTVITMGALQRDFSLLAEIVRGCPDLHWIVCKGRKNVDKLFAGLDNVELKGFLEEEELRHQMSRADISLNVLEDTVGSNVITTSMAMGLAIVVSDVGSIHDYCSEKNAVFCQNNARSFIDALNTLAHDNSRLMSLRKSAYDKSTSFRIEKVDEWFDSINH